MSPINTLRRKYIQLASAGSTALLLGPIAQAKTEAGRLDGGLFEVFELDWFDGQRGRAVPTRLYRPRGQNKRFGDACPIMVFSHGLGGSRAGYRYLAEFLASRGVACLHPQHVGSDRTIWSSGSPFLLADRLLAASGDAEAIARVFDLRYVLDRLQADTLAAGFDFSRIIVAGHSYGANSALLMGGASVVRNGQAVDFRDSRPKAVIALSAPAFYGEPSWASILGPMNRPSLHVTCSEDLIRIPGLLSGPEDRLAIFQASGGRPKCLAMFEGGSHSVFTDREAPGGYEANRQIKRATCDLVLEFLRLTFDRDQSALANWQLKYESLLSRFILL
jgi:dienelactone hydrolase